MDEHQRLARGLVGVRLIEIGQGENPLVVTGFGAGIVMAAADHLQSCYPNLALLVGELPGALSLGDRCVALDYLTTAFRSLVLLWSSIRPLDDYLALLEERLWNPRNAYLYLRGVGESNALHWQRKGVILLNQATLWGIAPLGNFESMRCQNCAGSDVSRYNTVLHQRA